MPSPFDWKGAPSVLAEELKPLKTGRTRSQTATRSVARKTAREGVNPGTIRGLSAKGDAQIRSRRTR